MKKEAIKWTNPADAMPNEQEPVLVYVRCGGVSQILIGAYAWERGCAIWYDWVDGEDFHDDPDYWCLLPKPPR